MLHINSYAEIARTSPSIRQKLFHWNYTVWVVLVLTTGNAIGAHVLVMDQEKGRVGLSGTNFAYFAYQFPGRNIAYNG